MWSGVPLLHCIFSGRLAAKTAAGDMLRGRPVPDRLDLRSLQEGPEKGDDTKDCDGAVLAERKI